MPTLTSDPLDILLAYDAWGTRLLLDRCRPLSREQFHRRFEIGPGSLHDTFTHMIGAMRRWSDRLAGRPLRPALMFIPERPDIAHDSAERTVEQLIDLHAQAAADISAIARDVRAGSGLASTIALDWPVGGRRTWGCSDTRLRAARFSSTSAPTASTTGPRSPT